MTTNNSNERTTVFLCGMTGSRTIVAADGRTRRRSQRRKRVELREKVPVRKSQKGFGNLK